MPGTTRNSLSLPHNDGKRWSFRNVGLERNKDYGHVQNNMVQEKLYLYLIN
jgi:hypothetical protein